MLAPTGDHRHTPGRASQVLTMPNQWSSSSADSLERVGHAFLRRTPPPAALLRQGGGPAGMLDISQYSRLAAALAHLGPHILNRCVAPAAAPPQTGTGLCDLVSHQPSGMRMVKKGKPTGGCGDGVSKS